MGKKGKSGEWEELAIQISGQGGNYSVGVVGDPKTEKLNIGDLRALLGGIREERRFWLLRNGEVDRHARPPSTPIQGEVQPLTPDQVATVLTNAVFTKRVSQKLSGLRGITGRGRVWVKLLISPSELAAVPWELLRDPNADATTSLALDRDFRVSRCIVNIEDEFRPLFRKLRVLFMSYGSDLNFQGERDALEKLRMSKLIVLDKLEGESATYDALKDAIDKGRYDVFHFAGHSYFDDGGSSGKLCLHDGDLDATRLSILFKDSGVRFAFLNSCDSALGAVGDAFAGAAHHMAAANVPYVLAMQTPIADRAAGRLASALYPRIAEGLSVSDSLREARKAIAGTQFPPFAWATPVLYLSSSDGRLVFPRRWKLGAVVGVAVLVAAGVVVARPSPPFSPTSPEPVVTSHDTTAEVDASDAVDVVDAWDAGDVIDAADVWDVTDRGGDIGPAPSNVIGLWRRGGDRLAFERPSFSGEMGSYVLRAESGSEQGRGAWRQNGSVLLVYPNGGEGACQYRVAGTSREISILAPSSIDLLGSEDSRRCSGRLTGEYRRYATSSPDAGMCYRCIMSGCDSLWRDSYEQIGECGRFSPDARPCPSGWASSRCQ